MIVRVYITPEELDLILSYLSYLQDFHRRIEPSFMQILNQKKIQHQWAYKYLKFYNRIKDLPKDKRIYILSYPRYALDKILKGEEFKKNKDYLPHILIRANINNNMEIYYGILKEALEHHKINLEPEEYRDRCFLNISKQ